MRLDVNDGGRSVVLRHCVAMSRYGADAHLSGTDKGSNWEVEGFSRTTSLTGPEPWISQEILSGPPRPSATGSMPLRVGSRSHTAVGKAGSLITSATTGSLSLAMVISYEPCYEPRSHVYSPRRLL